MTVPFVSVIIPTYNGSRFIKETVQSVIGQTYPNIEIIIVDDGSTDNTPDIVKSINDPRLIHIRQANSGVSMARNHGIDISHGDYIAFLDHDDVWLPHKLERQLQLFKEDPNIAMVYSDTFIIDENNSIINTYSHKIKFYRGMIFKELFFSCFITILTVVIKKPVFLEVGPFLPFKIGEDYDLFLKCAARYPIDYIDEPLAKYRVHESNYSKNYETEVSECIEIFDFWKNQGNVIGYDMNKLVGKAIINTYYNAFKNALRRRKDYKGAIKYFFYFFIARLKSIVLRILLKTVFSPIRKQF